MRTSQLTPARLVTAPRSVVAAGLVALGLAATGCTAAPTAQPSSGAPVSEGDIAYAQAIVDRYAFADVVWEGPTEPVEMAEGKSLVVVALTMTSVSNQRVSAGVQEAAELGGWDVTIIDGQGLQDKFAAGIDSAVAQGADGIVLMGTQYVPEALDRAAAAGIPIVGAIDTIANPLFENEAYAHMVAERGEDLGAAAAAQLVVDLGADATVATYAAALGDPLGDLLVAGAEDVFEQTGNPIATQLSLDFAELGTGTIGQRAVAAVQANPEIEGFWVSWDGAAGEVVTAFLNAGIDVPVYSTYADPQNIDFVRRGQVQRADVAVALEWDGWAIVDNFNRIFAGEPLARDEPDGVPIKLINMENLDEVLPGDTTAWDGEYDFRAEYSSLWGVDG